MRSDLPALLAQLASEADDWEPPAGEDALARQAWSTGRRRRGTRLLAAAAAVVVLLLLGWPVAAWLRGSSGPLGPDLPAAPTPSVGARLPERISKPGSLTGTYPLGTHGLDHGGPVAAVLWHADYALALGGDGDFMMFDEPGTAWATVSPDGTLVAWGSCGRYLAEEDCDRDEVLVRNQVTDASGSGRVISIGELRWGEEAVTLDPDILRWSPAGDKLLIGAQPVAASGVAPIRALVIDPATTVVTPVRSIGSIAGWRDETHVVAWQIPSDEATTSGSNGPGSTLRLTSVTVGTDERAALAEAVPPPGQQVSLPVVMSGDGRQLSAAGSGGRVLAWSLGEAPGGESGPESGTGSVVGVPVAMRASIDSVDQLLPAGHGFLVWRAYHCLTEARTARCLIAVDPRVGARPPAIAVDALDRPLVPSFLGTRTGWAFWHWPWVVGGVAAALVVGVWLAWRRMRAR